MAKTIAAAGDIAAIRRDRVSLCKKIFLFVKLGCMFLLSIVGSLYFVWSQYVAQHNVTKYGDPVWSAAKNSCVQFIEENPMLTISCVVLGFVACSFVAFLVLHGIETLVIKFMMRKANTGR